MDKPTVEQVIEEVRKQEAESARLSTANIPPVAVDRRKRSLIKRYIDMNLTAAEIAQNLVRMQRVWWEEIGRKFGGHGQ